MTLVAVQILLCISLLINAPQVKADCQIDPSVAEQDKPAVSDVINLLKPFEGQLLKAQGAGGVSYLVSVCGADVASDLAQSAVVEVNGTSRMVVGLSNRTIASQGDDWLQLLWLSNTSYNNTPTCAGSNRSVRLLIACNADVSGALELRVDAAPGASCFTSLSASHSLVCSASHQGLGGFSVFLIIMTVLFLTYLCLGGAYMRFVKGAKGADQVPHKEFWFRTGNAFADCCGALCRCDKYFGDGNFDDYTSVSGASAAYAGDGALRAGGGQSYQTAGYSEPREQLLSNQRSSDSELLQP
ncbi:cation-dependent mannose-6-phosphate receptor [Hyalella azteca]|uniref:Cation-dependent mannose-6-phosphate receptor n=1 Tax=Hyalella azteca TaxID=294128 RepID=A0A8B7MYB5_HYAAZ|nr:cation-dependent mannose-6-phosphate receptor [Hyalella azteca]